MHFTRTPYLAFWHEKYAGWKEENWRERERERKGEKDVIL
jgi:hypothetical protein